MTFYKVTYEHKAGIFCSCIADAESAADVKAHFAQYPIINLCTATHWDLEEAERKHMPIVKCEPATKAAQTAHRETQQTAA